MLCDATCMLPPDDIWGMGGRRLVLASQATTLRYAESSTAGAGALLQALLHRLPRPENYRALRGQDVPCSMAMHASLLHLFQQKTQFP